MTESESLERAIHEEVALVPHDPLWPALFQAERERLMSLFPPQLLDVQHFGSTAIPGMPAKPIIDILAGVASLAVAGSCAGPRGVAPITFTSLSSAEPSGAGACAFAICCAPIQGLRSVTRF